MIDEEKLIQTRNFIRWLFRKLDNEIFDKGRMNHKFFFEMAKRGADVDVIREDHGRYILTDKETENWHRTRGRHLGKHPCRTAD